MSRVLRVPSTVRSSVSEVWRFFRTFVSFFSRHHVCYQKIENKLDSRNNLKKLYSSRDLKHYLRGIFFFFFFFAYIADVDRNVQRDFKKRRSKFMKSLAKE